MTEQYPSGLENGETGILPEINNEIEDQTAKEEQTLEKANILMKKLFYLNLKIIQKL